MNAKTAKNLKVRALLRDRTRQQRATAAAKRRPTQLAASCKRRPRSITTHLLAAGFDTDTAAGAAGSMRSVAKRLGIKPVVARSRRTSQGWSRKVRNVFRYTRAQIAAIAAAYRPRKAEYKAVAARLALAA